MPPNVAHHDSAARIQHRALTNALDAASHASPTPARDDAEASQVSEEAPALSPASGPPIYAVSSAHIAARRHDTADWIVEGWLARKLVTLLAAIPKGGKSTIVTALVRDQLLGAALSFDTWRPNLRPDEDILWLTEEPGSIFWRRLIDDFGIPEICLGRLLVAYRREFRGAYKWPTYLTTLTEQLRARHEATGRRIGCVIVDTFSAWTGLEGDQEKQEGAINQAFAPLLALAEATGAAVLVLHHCRKAGGEHGLSVRGSTAITANVDAIIELDRPAGRALPGVPKWLSRNVRVLRALGRLREFDWSETVIYRDHPCMPILYDAVPGKPADDKASPRLDDRGKRALTKLAEAGAAGMPRAELTAALGLTKDQAKKLFPALVENGLAKADGKGKGQRLSITESGKQALAGE